MKAMEEVVEEKEVKPFHYNFSLILQYNSIFSCQRGPESSMASMMKEDS